MFLGVSLKKVPAVYVELEKWGSGGGIQNPLRFPLRSRHQSLYRTRPVFMQEWVLDSG